MRGSAWTATLRLANELRELSPGRVVVIGHADNEGTCTYNDTLGLKRAEAVKLQLVKAGIAPERIRAVTLGKRRPLDFSSTPEADALNRRVEILVERASNGADERAGLEPYTEINRAIPYCNFDEIWSEPQ